ncbi:DUF2510 domain-containing protein [Williamsia herbipolensis]|uniref:DUF2510 domain-containing protein n=1 Tax=Williamsia herbipolensis TaxID=1603258 RepID=UPI0005F83014|nr:DUF2510 domain-containing protein [Williamsia herbipolensis]
MTTPTGWHPDPEDSSRERWWDGKNNTWTSDTRNAGGPPSYVASQPPKKNRRGIWIGAGVALVVIIIIGAAVSGGDDGDTSTAAKESTPTTYVTVTPSVDPAAVAAAESSRVAESAAAASASAAAAAAREREQAALRDPASYTEVGDRGWALIAKDPDGHIGEKVRIYGKVTQFDSATGTTTFRADTEGVPQEYGFEYNVNTVVNEGMSGGFDDVVEDDLVTLYVKVDGSKSYDTTMGGSTTVPEVTAYVIEVTGSDR